MRKRIYSIYFTLFLALATLVAYYSIGAKGLLYYAPCVELKGSFHLRETATIEDDITGADDPLHSLKR